MSIQNVNFSSIEELLDYLPEHELKIVEFLRQLIHECIPNCKEKLAYNVPYFYRHSRICFIWPSSVTWGNVKVDGVMIGFTNGHLLSDEINYLEKGNRKKIYTKTFFNIEEIETDILKTFLFEAVELDKKK